MLHCFLFGLFDDLIYTDSFRPQKPRNQRSYCMIILMKPVLPLCDHPTHQAGTKFKAILSVHFWHYGGMKVHYLVVEKH